MDLPITDIEIKLANKHVQDNTNLPRQDTDYFTLQLSIVILTPMVSAADHLRSAY